MEENVNVVPNVGNVVPAAPAAPATPIAPAAPVAPATPVTPAAPAAPAVEVMDDGTLGDENYDDSDNYVKAKTFPINENWPDEIKQQMQQFNQMAELLNDDSGQLVSADAIEAEAEASSEEAENVEDVDGEQDADDSDDDENDVQSVATEETETFDNIF